jgi:hypothetical protein
VENGYQVLFRHATTKELAYDRASQKESEVFRALAALVATDGVDEAEIIVMLNNVRQFLNCIERPFKARPIEEVSA